MKNIFLTGSSSGIGRAAAELLTRRNYAVWGTSRSRKRLPSLRNFHGLEMDLADPPSIHSAWKQALEEAGRIDVVIQNAGAGICGAIEEVSSEDAAGQWRLLVDGPLELFKLAATHLRPRREGLIIGVSSLAAELPLPFGAHYSAGKAALSSFLASLSMELRPFDISVVDLRPGDIRTAFIDDLPKTMPAGSPYLPWSKVAWKRSCELIRDAPPAQLIAEAMLQLIETGKPPLIARRGSFFQATLGPLGPRLLPHSWLLQSIRGYFHLLPVDRHERKS